VGCPQRGAPVLPAGADEGGLCPRQHLHTLRRDRPYERMNITGIQGLTQAEIATLRALGAIEDAVAESP